MPFLFELYGSSSPMVEVMPGSVADAGGLSLEAEMFVMPVMTVLCSAGIAFYVRFLVALYKECKPRRIGYWVRMGLGSGEDTIAELQQGKRPVTRAA